MLVKEIVEGIKHGVRKVNIDTDLRLASTGAIRKFLAENPAEFDPRKYLVKIIEAMKGICLARYQAFSWHKGRKVEEILEEEPGYFGWILNADFPLYTKKVLTAIRLRKMTN